jgi:hypothetical protein
VPGQDGVRFDDYGHVLQCLRAELLADLRQSCTLSVGQSYTALELVAQKTILRDAETQSFPFSGLCIRCRARPLHLWKVNL